MDYHTFTLTDNTMFDEKDDSEKSGGLHYVMSYTGGLKTIEQVLSVTVVLALLIFGQQSRTYLLFGVALFSLLLSLIFTILHTFTDLDKTYRPLYWIEFGFCLACGLFYILGSTAVWTVYTQWYIIISVVGFVASVTYLIDTVIQFRLAQSPARRYVWTTPHMTA